MGQVNIKFSAEIEAEELESKRRTLQKERDDALDSIVHTFEDGRIMQVRPKDLGNIQTAISQGIEQKWIMEDNTTRLVTIEELQQGMAAGIQQGQAIWAKHADDLDELFGE